MAIITKKGQPISGGAGQFRPRPPVLTNQATTSSDAQQITSRPASPFDNPYGSVNVPAPTNANDSHPYGNPAKTLLPKQAGARVEQYVGCGDTRTTKDMLDAVGEPRIPSGYNSIMSGFPTRGSRRVIGNGNQPSAKGRRR